MAVELKATERVRDIDLAPIRAIDAEHSFKQRVVVSEESVERVTADGIRILPVDTFLNHLWRGTFDLS